jgi:hypothetical protein
MVRVMEPIISNERVFISLLTAVGHSKKHRNDRILVHLLQIMRLYPSGCAVELFHESICLYRVADIGDSENDMIW